MTGISVIGAGVIGRVHAENISRSPDCRLIQVADRDRAKAKLLAGRFRAEDRETAVEAVLADERVDAVVIASSTSAHEEHALAAARAGKAILIERKLRTFLDEGAPTLNPALGDLGLC